MYFLTLLSAVLIGNFTLAAMPIVTELSQARLQGIDQVIEKALDTFKVPGVGVGIVVDGQVILAKGYGFRDKEQQLPVTENTLFPIGSCTKAFTTFLLGQLVDEGLIHWDDPVIQYLPNFLLYDEYVTQHLTIRDTVTHRSGLPRYDFIWYNSQRSPAEMLDCLQYLEPSHDLRQTFNYNNLMFIVAGQVIEKVTGQSWEDNTRSRILMPLGMTDCNFSVLDSQKTSDFSLPYAEKNGSIRAIPFRNISKVGPAGSINSNILDMVKWLQSQLSDGQTLIQKDTLQEIQSLQFATPEFPKSSIYDLGYGLGWFIGIHKGSYSVYHRGAIDGFISQVSLLPRRGFGVVVLSNSMQGFFAVSAISKTIFDRLLGIEEEDWIVPAPKQPETIEAPPITSVYPLQDYVGNYEHPAYGTMEISLERGDLVACLNDIVMPLLCKEEDVFYGSEKAIDNVFASNLSKFDFTFVRDFSGKIVELHIPYEPMVKPLIFKLKDNSLPVSVQK